MKFANRLFIVAAAISLCVSTIPRAYAQTDDTTYGSTDAYGSHDQHEHRQLQLGADLIFPYRTTSPDGRLATLLGASAEYFLIPEFTVGLEVIFGVEDEGFVDPPIYIAPGVAYYFLPWRLFEPFVAADVPILLNNNEEVGIRGGLGIMFNILPVLGIKYSFDVSYFFDSEVTILNLAHVAAVFNL